MIVSRMRHVVTLTSVALLLTACANPPPLLSFDDRNCDATPNRAAAYPLQIDADAPVRVTIDEKTACLRPDGKAARLYAMFLIPQSPSPFFLSIMSEPRGRGVLAPHLALLDGEGRVIREIGHDKFQLRGSSLGAAFRPQGGEIYLLVASEPDVVGQQSSHLVAMTQANTVATGTGGFIMVTTGHERTQTLTRAHGGVITVSAEPVPLAPGR